MKDWIIDPFVEGFLGCFRLAIDLFVAVWTAVATVTSDFVNGRPRQSYGKKPNT